ncbi:Hsp20/alpha crystallin family protein [Lactiplantibacillus modestisalitolerans]|uniref:Hsp20/alpha crystallin family protein n=1 Tax=Lactiplantibacillus modestisalitolerans TaxID=1457219 RepID=A0ABV5WW48_9LACO|nr:Hsp20/alpha crystallin family protein [Lactiplantibacillus modestisalitolerans]
MFRHLFSDQHLKTPVEVLQRVQRDVTHVLNPRTVMRTDVVEHDDDYTVTAELPGFDKDALTVKFADEWLTIRANSRTAGSTQDDGRWLHQERRATALSRRFYFADVDAQKIQAHYHAGLLAVTLPKEAAAASSKIEIQ